MIDLCPAPQWINRHERGNPPDPGPQGRLPAEVAGALPSRAPTERENGMEPLSLLVGGVLLAVGYVAGRGQGGGARGGGSVAGGRHGRPPAPPPPMTPLCGCGHALSQHDRETSTCYAELRRDTFDRRGRWSGHSWVPCTCRQYVGPRPIDEVFAPRLLPPSVD